MKAAELFALAEAQWIRSHAMQFFFGGGGGVWKKAYMSIVANQISISNDISNDR